MTNPTLLATLAVAAPLVVGAVGSTFAQSPAPPSMNAPAASTVSPVTPIGEIGSRGPVLVRGEVAEIFGNKFVLQDPSGRTLIEMGPRGRDTTVVTKGQQITVEGRSDSGSIVASVLVHGDGRRDVVGPAGPPERGTSSWFGSRPDQAGVITTLERAGYTNVRIADQKKKHYEVLARDAQGAEWELHVGFDGQIRERERAAPTMNEAQVKTLLERSGYVYGGRIERRKKHTEVLATNDRGEAVELHVDRSGQITKEKRRFW